MYSTSLELLKDTLCSYFNSPQAKVPYQITYNITVGSHFLYNYWLKYLCYYFNQHTLYIMWNITTLCKLYLQDPGKTIFLETSCHAASFFLLFAYVHMNNNAKFSTVCRYFMLVSHSHQPSCLQCCNWHATETWLPLLHCMLQTSCTGMFVMLLLCLFGLGCQFKDAMLNWVFSCCKFCHMLCPMCQTAHCVSLV